MPTAVWPFLLLLQSQPLASCIAFQGKVLARGYPAKGSALSSSALSPNLSSPAWQQFSPLFQPSCPWTLEAWGPEAVSWCLAGLMSLHFFFFFCGGLGGLFSPPPLALSKEFYGKDQLLARLGRAGGGEGGCELHLLFSLAGREEYGIKIFFRSCARRERLWGTGAGKKSLPCGETAVGG